MQEPIELTSKEQRGASRVADHYRTKAKRDAAVARKLAGPQPKRKIKQAPGFYGE